MNAGGCGCGCMGVGVGVGGVWVEWGGGEVVGRWGGGLICDYVVKERKYDSAGGAYVMYVMYDKRRERGKKKIKKKESV